MVEVEAGTGRVMESGRREERLVNSEGFRRGVVGAAGRGS